MQQAAWKFIEHCTSTEVTTSWSKTTGYMPVRVSARDSEEMQSYVAEFPNAKTAVDQPEKGHHVDTVMFMEPNGGQIIGQGWERILVNERPRASSGQPGEALFGSGEVVFAMHMVNVIDYMQRARVCSFR